MEVIPVIDLKDGQVVHAVAGQRDRYAPVSSPLTPTPRPFMVAKAFESLGLNSVYVADLDAIQGTAEADECSLAEIATVSKRVLWDAGLQGADASYEQLRLSKKYGAQVVVALETLVSTAALAALLQQLGDDLVFSLDLRNGQPHARAPELQSRLPLEIATLALELGVRQMIVLDIAQVGTGKGLSTLPLIKEIKTRHSDVSVISGGGVRDVDDLRRMADAGCNAALVASALHSGAIGSDELDQVSGWS